jgi:hypothetical protein
MTTATKNRRPQTRTAKLMQLGNVEVLALTTGKETVFYRLESLLADAGRGFRLVKADRGNGPEETYDVLLDGQFSTCECKGFLRWNHCKHVESLSALCEVGKLPAAPVPAVKPTTSEAAPATQSKPEPAPQAPHVCFECGRPSDDFYCDRCGYV